MNLREQVKEAKRIVVKVGTSTLTTLTSFDVLKSTLSKYKRTPH